METNAITLEFKEKIDKAYEEAQSYETFGNYTEFYDEDDSVIMTVHEEGDQIIFNFGDGEDFTMNVNERG